VKAPAGAKKKRQSIAICDSIGGFATRATAIDVVTVAERSSIDARRGYEPKLSVIS
jgi:hypothetical protein